MSLKKFLANVLPDKFPPPAIDPCCGDDMLRQAAAAAVAGDHRRAESYLDSQQDWDDRAFAIGYFAQCGQGQDWCDRWHDAVPDSRHAPAVHAARLVELAWSARGGAWSPSAGGFQTFQTLLDEASRATEDAAGRWPADPVPWSTRIAISIGRQEGLATARAHFEQACHRAPLLIEAHWLFLQASCAKWGGSDQDMMAHASAGARAPDGHPLHALPLFAIKERTLLRALAGDKPGAAAIWTAADAVRSAEAAAQRYIRSPARKASRYDPKHAGMVALASARAGRDADAAAAFAVCANLVSESVWGDGENGKNHFARIRRECHAAAR